MKRTTIYTVERTIDDLNAAIERVQEAAQSGISKAFILEAFIKAGLEQEPTVQTRIRQRVERERGL